MGFNRMGATGVATEAVCRRDQIPAEGVSPQFCFFSFTLGRPLNLLSSLFPARPACVQWFLVD